MTPASPKSRPARRPKPPLRRSGARPASMPAHRSTEAEAEALFAELVAGPARRAAIAAMLIALRLKGESDRGADRRRPRAARRRPPISRGPIICSPTAAAPAATDRARSTSRPRPPSPPPRPACRSPSTATARSPRAAARPTCSSSSAPGSTSRAEAVAPGARRDRHLLPVRAALPSRPAPCRAGAPGAQGADDHEHARPLRESGRAAGAAARRRRSGSARAGRATRSPRSACAEALVVHGAGLDEIALHARDPGGPAAATARSRRLTIAPEEAGLERRPVRGAERRRPGGECRAAEGAADGLRASPPRPRSSRSTPAPC